MEVVRTFLTVVRSRSRGRPVPVELVASGLEQAPCHSRASPRSLIVLPDSFDTPCLTPAPPCPTVLTPAACRACATRLRLRQRTRGAATSP